MSAYDVFNEGGGGGYYDPFGGDYFSVFDASNGQNPYGGYGGYGGSGSMGGFSIDPFGGGGGGLFGSGGVGGAAASGVGSLLGNLFAGLARGGSSGGGSGSININNGGGTNQYDALLQNPYLLQTLLGVSPSGTTTGDTSQTGTPNGLPTMADLIQQIFGGMLGQAPGSVLDPTTGKAAPPGSTIDPKTGQVVPPKFNTAALGPLLSGLLGLGNAGLNTYGALQGTAQQAFNNQGKTDTQSLLNSLISGNQGSSNYLMGQILPEMQGLMQNLGPAYSNGLTQGNNALQAGFGGLQSFKTPTQTSAVPGLQGVFDQLGGLQGYGNQLLGQLAPMATGQTGPQQQAMQQALALASGSNSGQSALSNTAMQLLNGGQSPLTAASQSAAINALLNGGMTSGLQSLTNPATGLANGQNPTAQALQQRGLALTGQNPLLPLNQVISLTQNQAATNAQHNLNSVRRQMLDRTGTTGPAIASGSENELLSQIGDQAMQSQADALTNALMGQQGLQLSLFGQGAGMANSGLSGQLQGQSLGMNSLLQQASQALQNQTGLGGLGNSGLNTYLAQLGLGGNLVGQGSSSQASGLQALNALLGTQNGATNALSGLLGQTGNLTGQASQDVFYLQNLGLNQTKSQYDALGNLISGQNTQNSNLLNGLGTTAGFGNNYAQNLLGQVPNFTSSLSSLFNGGNTPQNLFNNVLGNTAFSTGGVQTKGT